MELITTVRMSQKEYTDIRNAINALQDIDKNTCLFENVLWDADKEKDDFNDVLETVKKILCHYVKVKEDLERVGIN